MKHKLLFLFVIFIFPVKNFAQLTHRDPPPCGILSLEACDANNDGVSIFDLTVYDNVYPFCIYLAFASDYYPPTHHLTQADADTGANPIANPESFVGYDGQPIFMRAEPIDAGANPVLATQTYGIVFSCPDPSFTMTPTCDGAIATITGDIGGTFILDPQPGDATLIDPITGEVVLGISESTYCVTYTLWISEPISSTVCFTVLPYGDSSFYMTPTCDGGTATITGDTGGTFYFNPNPADGVVIDAITGEVTGGIPGTMYTVEYTIAGQCGSSTLVSFTPLTPIVNEPSNLTLCDELSDGFEVFDLTQAEPEITGGNPNVTLSYFETLSNAQNNVSSIANADAYNNIVNPQTIYIRAEDSSGCYDVTSMELSVVDCADTDDDGVADIEEDLNGNGDLDDDDTDNDTIPNYLDADDDGDHVDTIIEVTLSSTLNRLNSSHEFIDTDGDLIENYLDDDDDGDGILTIDEDYNGNGDPTDDDTNINGIPDYLEYDVALGTDHFNIQTIKFYPNPVESVLNLVGHTGENCEIQIIDLQGKLIYNQKLEGTSLDVSQLNPGIYFLKVQNGPYYKVFKLLKK